MKKLGDILIESALITKEQLDEALQVKKKTNKKIGDILIELGYVSDIQIMKTLEYQCKIPYVDFNEIRIDNSTPGLISEEVARKYCTIPIGFEPNGVLVVVLNDPLDFIAIDEIRYITGKDILPKMSTRKQILEAIDTNYGKENAQRAAKELEQEIDLIEMARISEQITDEVANAPVVKLVNSIIEHAIKIGASDVHIEPTEERMRVRIRLDGILQEIMTAPKSAHPAVITRVKIMGGMDIAEKRIPQDGRVEATISGKKVDLRLSILPTVNGEKVVIRILGRSDIILSKNALGLSDNNEKMFDRIIASPHGIILVSGPTGSGKTTTLYTILKDLNKITTNIVTVEDPVEYRLAGVNQVQVNVKAGMGFANGLRSILRQDPDIILIGEIRDGETAEIAIRASITGHLVLSTIHTNDSVSTVSRLVDMGIDPYMVSSSLVGVIAQRLVRKICTRCKETYKPSHSETMMLKMREPKPLFRGVGCPECNFTGYKGRTAIHEILIVTRDIRELIDRRASEDQIRAVALRQGMMALMDTCIKLVLDGITTASEMIKVTYTVDEGAGIAE
jgi:type IV pilus assembly protein PilB